MMRAYTNLTWPDDPYRTGQQLYRRPVSRLAAFAARPGRRGRPPVPAAAAIVYLPLHRTQAVARDRADGRVRIPRSQHRGAGRTRLGCCPR